jgi:NitT/TauT family transport system ATP-binding protein
MISFDHVNKKYDDEVGITMRDITLSIADGSFVCIVGGSGSGKSTILKLIARIKEPSSGTIITPDVVSMVFQTSALLPWLTVFNNVKLPIKFTKMTREERKKATAKYIKLVGLEGFENKYPHDLSEGQKQRVGIARALIVNPDVLLLDEPFSALDIKTARELYTDLIKIWKKTNKTVVMVSHNVEEAVLLSQEIIFIEKGVIVNKFKIGIDYPRKENDAEFIKKVNTVRRALLK